MSLLFNSNLLLIIPEFCLIIALPLVAYFLLYQRHKCAYWQARGVPGPKPSLISGNLAPLFFGGQSNVLTMHDWAGQFGRLYGCMWGQTPVLVFSRPEMVQQLLVTKFWQFHARMIGPIAGDPDRLKWVHLFNARGMRWKRLRAIATPAFSVSNLKKIIPTIDDSIKKAIKILEDTVLPTGKTLNIHPHFVEMAFDIIARVAMGQPESRQFHPESEAKLAVAAIQRINNNLFDYYAWLFPWLGRNVLRPLAAWTRRWRNDPIENLLAKIHAAVQERKRLKESGELDRNIGDGRLEDFIDLFLEAEVDDLELEEEAQRRGTSSVVGGGEKMARIERKNCLEEVVMQCFLFVLAGFDTTSSSLSQICHRLAWNPQVQEKLQAEIDSVCGRDVDDWVPSYEQLAQLKYTEAVIKETLRLSPRVIARSCTQKTTLGDLQIEEGVGVQIDVLTLHRDQSVWGQDAELFVPERWEEPNSRSAMYLAFGIGPRICIGMRMALMQNKMALVRLMQRFSVRRCAQTERKIEFAGQVVLAPKSVCVMLEPR